MTGSAAAVRGTRRAAAVALLVASLVVTGAALARAEVIALVADRLGTGAVPPPPLYPTSLQISGKANGAGTPQRDDVVTITFSTDLAPTWICSSASPTAATQTVNGVTVQLTAGDAGGQDTLTFAAPLSTCADGLRIGTVGLGATGYVTGEPVSFIKSTATLSDDGAGTTLAITLGSPGSDGRRTGTVTTATVARYTPDAAVTDTAGRSISTNVAETPSTVQF